MYVNEQDMTDEVQAMVHLAAGKFAGMKIKVAPGVYKLGGRQLILTFPDHAVVTRAEGTNGDGTDSMPAPRLSLSQNAILLFLERIDAKGKDDIWAECIRADLKGTVAAPPDEALAGLAVVQAEQPEPEVLPKRSTPAKRTGEKEIAIEARWKPRDPKPTEAAPRKAKGKKSAA